MRLSKLNEMDFERVLDIFLDPEAAKKQLKVYQDARATANVVIEQSNKRAEDLDAREALLNTYDASFDGHRKELERLKADIAMKQADLARREEAVQSDHARNDVMHATLKEKLAEVNTRLAGLDKQAADLKSGYADREEALAAAEKKVREDADRAAAKEAAAEARHQALLSREYQLKALLGG